MKRQLSGVNLVVILAQPNKSAFKINELLELYPGESPGLFWPPQPEAPGIIDYTNRGRQIVLVENRLQIQARVSESVIPADFLHVARKTLEAANGQAISAYGFNFDFQCTGLQEVKKLFDIHLRVSSFDYLPRTHIRLAFQRQETIFQIDIEDGTPTMALHVNAHHERNTTAGKLVDEVERQLREDWEHAQELIKEVLSVDGF